MDTKFISLFFIYLFILIVVETPQTQAAHIIHRISQIRDTLNVQTNERMDFETVCM